MDLLDELQNNLQAHLQQLVRDRDPYLATEGHFYVQTYIRQQFDRWGNSECYEFTVRGRVHRNWILNLTGDRSSTFDSSADPSSNSSKLQQHPLILVGAHYDAVPGSPGADDNATGVAVLLELARIFAAHPPRYPVRLIAFDLEETGLAGSRAYAAYLRQQKQPLRLMLSLEMLGYCDRTPNSQTYPTGLKYFYPNQGNFIALVGNLSTVPDLIRLSRSIRRAGQVPCQWLPAGRRGMLVPDTRRSDHAPFWDEGYQAIMVTDTANLRNPHYHQASDRLDTLDLKFLAGVCQGLAHGIQEV